MTLFLFLIAVVFAVFRSSVFFVGSFGSLIWPLCFWFIGQRRPSCRLAFLFHSHPRLFECGKGNFRCSYLRPACLLVLTTLPGQR